MDNATVPWGDKRTDTGVAHKMQVKSAVAPTATTFDITTSWYASPEPDISEVAAKGDRLAIGLWGNNVRSYRFVGCNSRHCQRPRFLIAVGNVFDLFFLQ